MSSVCLSVMLVICDHRDWKSWKLIAQAISTTPSLFVAKRRPIHSLGNLGKIGGDYRGGVRKVACWRTKAAISLKHVKIEEKLLWTAYRNSPTLSSERYYPRFATAFLFPCLGVRNPCSKLQSKIVGKQVHIDK